MMHKSLFARKVASISLALLLATALVVSVDTNALAKESTEPVFNLSMLDTASDELDKDSGLELLRSEGDFALLKVNDEYAVASMNVEVPEMDEYALLEEGNLLFTVAFHDRVEIGWYEVSNRTTNYFIYRGDEIIGEVSGGSQFVDYKPDIRNSLEYRVETTSLIPESEWRDLLSEEDIELTLSGELNPPTRGHIWGLPTISIPDMGYRSAEDVYQQHVEAVAAATYTTVRWAAFIQDDYVYRDGWMSVGCPVLNMPSGANHTWFQGDNRSWNSTTSASATKYRVQKVVRKTWGTTASPQQLSNAVGPTKVYYSNTETSSKIYFAQATGTNTGTTMYQNNTTTAVGIQLKFNAKNPWCTVAVRPIEGTVDIGFSQSGYFNASGGIRVVPNHEYYIQWSNGSVKTVFRKTNAGFGCLNNLTSPLCGITTISNSGSGY